ncbi:hypothetical protein ACFWPK_28670 [Nocardia sp. NPDC058519]|uniref:hypothetical protein n=1 Tax=Nocardia sp. NPDC058519 TaxID=3346535 RepID=UPI00365143C8
MFAMRLGSRIHPIFTYSSGNARLARVEQIKKFTVLPAFWEPGGAELTPTLKLRRKPISTKYAAEIQELYA